MEERMKAVAEALTLLGRAYRMNWSDFDGRSLKMELEELAGYLTGNRELDVEAWAYRSSICYVKGWWQEDCDERGNLYSSCKHAEEYYEKAKVTP